MSHALSPWQTSYLTLNPQATTYSKVSPIETIEQLKTYETSQNESRYTYWLSEVRVWACDYHWHSFTHVLVYNTRCKTAYCKLTTTVRRASDTINNFHAKTLVFLKLCLAHIEQIFHSAVRQFVPYGDAIGACNAKRFGTSLYKKFISRSWQLMRKVTKSAQSKQINRKVTELLLPSRDSVPGSGKNWIIIAWIAQSA